MNQNCITNNYRKFIIPEDYDERKTAGMSGKKRPLHSILIKSDTDEEEEEISNLKSDINDLKIRLAKRYKRLNEIKEKRIKRKTEQEVRKKIRRETQFFLPDLMKIKEEEVEKRKDFNINLKSFLDDISSESSTEKSREEYEDDEDDNFLINNNSQKILNNLTKKDLDRLDGVEKKSFIIMPKHNCEKCFLYKQCKCNTNNNNK